MLAYNTPASGLITALPVYSNGGAALHQASLGRWKHILLCPRLSRIGGVTFQRMRQIDLPKPSLNPDHEDF